MNSKKVSVYDLVYYVIKKLNLENGLITNKLKKNILIEIKKLLSNGWIVEDIVKNIDSNASEIEVVNEKVDLGFFTKCKKSKFNLLNPSRIYFHKEITLSPNPVMVEFDYNTGELVRKNEEYFLEMKATYTVDDLLDYFISKPCLSTNSTRNIARTKGALEWLVNTYDLEYVLYMIDIANDHITFCNLEMLNNVMDIQNYFSKAKEAYTLKLNESRVNGDVKIVPRRRKIS